MKRRFSITCFFLLLVIFLISCTDENTGSLESSENNYQSETQSETESDTPSDTSIPDDTSSDASHESHTTVKFKASEGGYLTGTLTQTLEEGETTETVTAHPMLCYKFKEWSDGNTEPQRSKESFSENTELTAVFEYAGLPKIYVEYKGYLRRSKYTDATIKLENACGVYEFDTTGGQIKGRGNATWNHAKKPFVFKFDEAINLLGIGTQTSRDWVFFSNHGDQSLFRNYYAYNLAFEMGIGYRATQVEVYINGKYNGVYLVTGKVEESRLGVEIDTNGGFIIERDYYYSGTENKDYIWVERVPYTLKSDYLNYGQIKYIKSCLKDLDKAIAEGNEEKVRELVDIDSVVNMYLLQEYVKNTDVGWSSFYIYKCSGDDKMHFGPAWDFDIAMGNDYRLDKGSYENIYVGRYTGFAQENEWFYELCKTEWFRALVLERWNSEFKIKAEALLDELRSYANLNLDALKNNFVRWDKVFGNRVNCEPSQIIKLDTYEKHLEYFLLWMELRFEWLDNCFNTPEIWIDEIYDRTYPQYKGGKIPILPYSPPPSQESTSPSEDASTESSLPPQEEPTYSEDVSAESSLPSQEEPSSEDVSAESSLPSQEEPSFEDVSVDPSLPPQEEPSFEDVSVDPSPSSQEEPPHSENTDFESSMPQMPHSSEKHDADPPFHKFKDN